MRSNQYRSWSQDGRVLSQYREVPLWECPTCGGKVDTRMELVRDHQCKQEEKTVTQTAKQADIRYRVQLKDKPWIVVYKVASSDGVQVYDVTVVRGKVNNCTCVSRKPCYHMTGVQAREDEYNRNHDAERTAYNNYCLSMGI